MPLLLDPYWLESLTWGGGATDGPEYMRLPGEFRDTGFEAASVEAHPTGG